MSRRDRLARHVSPELSDARLERQCQAILARSRAPGSRALVWLWLVPAAAAVVAIAFFLARGSRPLDSVAPPEIATLKTEAESQALTLADGSRIEAAPSTKLVLGKVSLSEVRVDLDHGSVDCDVTKNPERRFRVMAGGYEVRVVGTRFRVQLSADEIRVEVSRGAVEVAREGEAPRRIADGETWSATLEQPHAATPEPAAEPAPSEAPPAVSRSVAAKSNESAKQLFDRAQRARAAGRVGEAREAFSALRARYPHDSRASLAAFELARLELDQKGDAKRASKLLDDAVKGSPSGSPLREDAEARRIEAFERAGDGSACRAARSDFLARYPKSVHRARVLRACPGS